MSAHEALPLLGPSALDGGESARGERRDAAENRERILAAARRLFAERGVDAVSMNQIAQTAGIGAGTLYRRYAHKGLLCAALLEENAGRSYREVIARLARPDAEEPALARVEFLLMRLLAFNEENASLLGAVHDAACGDRRDAVFDGPFYAWLHGTLAGLLTRAADAGECPPLDAEWSADALLAPLAIDLYLYQRRERGFTPARVAAAVRRMVAQMRCDGAAPVTPQGN